MRDWRETLLPASFNGLPFEIESDSETTGHRLANTPIPNGPVAVEAFGPELDTFSISAYVVDDAADVMSGLLTAVGRGGMPGALVLPAGGVRFVRLVSVTRRRDKDRAGYFALDIEAQGEPSFFGFLGSIVSLGVSLLQAATGGPKAMGASVGGLF